MRKRKASIIALILMVSLVFCAAPVCAGGNFAKDLYNAITYIPGPGWIIGYIGDWGMAGEAKYVYMRNMNMRNDRAANQAGNDAQSDYIKSLNFKKYVDKAMLAKVGADAKAAYLAKNPSIPMPGGNETSWALKHVFFKGLSGGPLRAATYGLARTFTITSPGELDCLSVRWAYNRPYLIDGLVILAHGASFGFGSIPSSGGLETLISVSQGLNLLAWDGIIGSGSDLVFGETARFLPAKYSPGGVKLDHNTVYKYYYSK